MTIFDFPELLEGDEELLHLNLACKKFKPPISKPTIVRYFCTGVRGVRLKTAKVGSRRYTTESAIREFTIAQLQNPASPGDESMHRIPMSPKRSARKTGGGMTPEEISSGLKRHGLK